VARAQARLRSADEGLPFAERAVHQSPSCARCFDTYALLLSEKQRFDDAVAAEERAIELLSEDARDTTYVERLRRYEEAAAKARPAAAEGASAPEAAP
jgi:hypothetical protein